jgi:RHS repeat-associated protein
MPPAPNLSLAYTSDLGSPVQVLELAGTQSVSRASLTRFPGQALTFELWVKTSASPSGGVLVAYAAGSAGQVLVRNPGALEVVVGQGTTGPTTAAVNDGRWHFLAVTLAPSRGGKLAVEVYVDGTLAWAAAGAVPAVALQPDSALVLGRASVGGAGNSVPCQLSEFCLWDGRRSAAQIGTDLQRQADSTDPALVLRWALSSPATSGTLDGNPAFVASTLAFRARQLRASWDPVAGASSYTLDVDEAGGAWRAPLTGLTGTRQDLSGVLTGARYSAMVRAVDALGQPGPWSAPASVRVLDLGPVEARLVADLSAGTLKAAWDAVDQAQSYLFFTHADGSQSPSGPPTTIQGSLERDLGPLLTDAAHAWQYRLRADSGGGSRGPASDAAALARPTLGTFIFENDRDNVGALSLGWDAVSGAAYDYLVVQKVAGTGRTDLARRLMAAGTPPLRLTPSLSEGDVLRAQVRPVAAGTLGAWSPEQGVTVRRMPAPTLGAPQVNVGASSIQVSWTFMPQPPAGVRFIATLTRKGETSPMLTATVQGSPHTFQDSRIQEGATFVVQVRATCDGSLSLWSQPVEAPVSRLPAVTLRSPTVSDANAITVNWWKPDGMPSDAVYVVSLNTPRAVSRRVAAGDTATTFSRSDTNAAQNTDYTITLYVEQGTARGPTATQTVRTRTTGKNPDDNENNNRVDDPINTTTGSYAYSHLELELFDPVPLQLATFYSSSTPTQRENPLYTDRPLGRRWSHGYATRLARNAENTQLWVLWGEGRVDSYDVPPSVTGAYAQRGIPSGDTLVLGADLVFVLTTRGQVQYRFSYDGRMRSITTPVGNRLDLTYNGDGRLASITNPVTRRGFTFDYRPDGLLSAVRDTAGRSVGFSYEGSDLKSVTNPLGKVRAFSYQGEALLQSVLDERGKTLVKNTYSEQLGAQRVTFQQDGRAVEAGQSYGSTLAYRRVTENGVDYILCDYTDRAGNSWTYRSVEANGNTVEATVQLPGGAIRRTTCVFDGNANKLSETVYEGPASGWSADKGNRWSYTYDGSNNLRSATDPAGRTVTWEYDAQNRVLRTTDALGNAVTYEYEGALLRRVVDLAGRVTQLGYQQGAAVQGLLETVTDPFGNVFRYDHDAGGLPRKVIDPYGNFTEYEYDAVGRRKSQTVRSRGGDVLRTTTYEYWDDNSLKSERVTYPGQPAGDAFVTSYTYDDAGNPKQFTDAAGNSVHLVYDANAQLGGVTFPAWQGMGRRVAWAYDRNDQLQRQTLSASQGIAIDYAFDVFGQLGTFTDPRGARFQRTYAWVERPGGRYHQQISEILPSPTPDVPGPFTRLSEYDPAGRLVSVRDLQQRVTTLGYSKEPWGSSGRSGSAVTVTLPPDVPDAPPLTRVVRRDPLGRAFSFTDEAGRTTTVARAPQGEAPGVISELVTVTDPTGRQRWTKVDPLGRVVEQGRGSGAEAVRTTYAYDALGRVTQVSELRPGTTAVVTTITYGYDATSRTVTATVRRQGAVKPLVVLHHDGLGRVVQEVDASGKVRRWAYTPWDTPGSFTAPDGTPTGKTVTFLYDDAGRQHRTNLPDGTTVERTFDKNGNPSTARIAGGAVVTREYDAWNRLISRTDAHGHVVRWTYKPSGRVWTISYPGAKTVEYGYDDLDRLISVKDWANRVTRYAYLPTGQVSRIELPNGTRTDLGWDRAGLLLSLTHTRGDEILARIVSSLDTAGRSRVVESILPLAPPVAADPHSLTYDDADQALTFDGRALERDDRGGLRTLPAGRGSVPLGYDDLGRVVTAGTDTSGYDPEGFRHRTVLSGVERRYVRDPGGYVDPAADWSGFTRLGRPEPVPGVTGGAFLQPGGVEPLDRVLQVTDAAGAVQARFVHGLGLISMEGAGGDARFFHFDSRGSTLALTDSQGDLTDRYAYGVYGQLAAREGATAHPFLYNGRDGAMDDGNGLVFLRARFYAPALMGFVQRDVLLGDPFQPQTLNRYAFVTNDPLGWVDPFGLSGRRDWWKWALGIGGGLLGLAALAGLGVGLYYFVPAFVSGFATALGGAAPALTGNALQQAGLRLGQLAGRQVLQSPRLTSWFRNTFPRLTEPRYSPVTQVELETFSGVELDALSDVSSVASEDTGLLSGESALEPSSSWSTGLRLRSPTTGSNW